MLLFYSYIFRWFTARNIEKNKLNHSLRAWSTVEQWAYIATCEKAQTRTKNSIELGLKFERPQNEKGEQNDLIACDCCFAGAPRVYRRRSI